MHRIENKKKSVYSVVHSIEQVHDEHCISDRSRETAGFIIRVGPTPTEHAFLRVEGEQTMCRVCGPVTTGCL